MSSPLVCPDCQKPLDVFHGTVSRQRSYPLTLLRGAPLVVDRVEQRAQVVTCSGCEYADTVANTLKAGAR